MDYMGNLRKSGPREKISSIISVVSTGISGMDEVYMLITVFWGTDNVEERFVLNAKLLSPDTLVQIQQELVSCTRALTTKAARWLIKFTFDIYRDDKCKFSWRSPVNLGLDGVTLPYSILRYCYSPDDDTGMLYCSQDHLCDACCGKLETRPLPNGRLCHHCEQLLESRGALPCHCTSCIDRHLYRIKCISAKKHAMFNDCISMPEIDVRQAERVVLTFAKSVFVGTFATVHGDVTVEDEPTIVAMLTMFGKASTAEVALLLDVGGYYSRILHGDGAPIAAVPTEVSLEASLISSTPEATMF